MFKLLLDRALCAFFVALLALPVLAQDAQEEPALEPAGESGLAPTLDVPTYSPDAAAGNGTVNGLVFDEATGTEMLGVEATLISADGSEFGKATTDATGAFQFDAVPAGTYSIRFEKPGYRTRRLTEFAVVANQVNPGNIALPPESAGSEAGGVEEIVITGVYKAPVADRPNADEFINTLDTAEIGKFAASDIGEAIKRIPGINVVEGQFAIIRGLEDRYSSTLFNSAPVPSPDPNSQSVQLDLFPSDVTSGLVVAKTFSSDLPSNSSGGSINIITHEFEDDLKVKLSGGSGFNENAIDRHLEWQELNPVGRERKGADATEGEFSALISGRRELLERELSFRGIFSWELDYSTKTGVVENLEPQVGQVTQPFLPVPPFASGGLASGELALSGGRFDFTESDRVRQTTGFVEAGYDLDSEGDHRVDFSFFYTKKQEEVVQERANGFVPGFDYSVPAAEQALLGLVTQPIGGYQGATRSSWIVRSWRENVLDGADRGSLWSSSFNDSRAFARDRDLFVYQFNGDHRFEFIEGLSMKWAANYAKTKQDDSYFAARYWLENDDVTQIPTEFPVTPAAIGPNSTFYVSSGIFQNANEIDEDQAFFRLDAEYEREINEWLGAVVSAGVWWEDAERSVASRYLESARVVGSGTQFAIAALTALDLGAAIDGNLQKDQDGSFTGTRNTAAGADRKIFAWNLGLKVTLWEDVDLLAGLRREQLEISSANDPFTGESLPDGTPRIYPSAFLMFDRIDNPARVPEFTLPPGTVSNSELLGIDVPVDPVTGLVDLTTRAQIEQVVSGDLDETRNLPSAGITWRAIDGMNVRAAYSKTVARPSFREIGYYLSVEAGSDDLVIGNPQLRLSDVESWDVRVEYVWGDFGDLAALSAFKKDIENPIESIVIRDPTNFDPNAIFRTFFNNSNTAKLWGIEAEVKKALDFFGVDGLEYLSIATNFTYIDAEVGRSAAEIAQAAPFFALIPGDTPEFTQLKSKRRLFSQPEWIVNGDLTFDHPDWGTKVTLAVFAISDVLDSAGNVTAPPIGQPPIFQMVLDRYVDSFHQVDLVASQLLTFESLPGEWTFKASIKNLTDSERRLIYDPAQTSRSFSERTFKTGRDYSFSLTFAHSF